MALLLTVSGCAGGEANPAQQALHDQIEQINLYQDGVAKPLAEADGVVDILVSTLQQLHQEYWTIFSEDNIDEMKQKSELVELIFVKPVDVSVENGERVLEDVKAVIFVLKDALDMGLGTHILVSCEKTEEICYYHWAVKSWVDEINECLVAAGYQLKVVSQEESQEIARQYLLNSPTFKFDGMEDSLELVATNTMKCPYCWEFVFEFQCRHAGYGDRTGQMLAEVITPHTARIIVDQGEVVSAIMDEKWDMMTQKLIEKDTTIKKVVTASCDDFAKLRHISQEVEITVGESFTVALCSNPTTGFQWSQSAQINDQTLLQQVDHKFVPPEEKDVMGAPGREVWTFKALKRGMTGVSMAYSRAWEGGDEGEWTFNLTVIVK
jgi:predicted secreted protein